MLEATTSILARSQNGDGGWGAFAARQSNTEATSLALLAMLSTAADATIADRARKWLITRQLADGSWPLNDSAKEPSWSTALAILALSSGPDDRERVTKAGGWLLEQAGGKPGLLAKLVLFIRGQKRVVRLNQDLIGWPWTLGNFSWV